MGACAAVMTGPGAGAIATIELHGRSAAAALDGIFKSSADKPLELTPGSVVLGHVVDGEAILDQVTLGCEAPDVFAIHCHGNPLIVERIMELLQRRGIELVSAEQLLARTLADRYPDNAIAVEAKLALTTVKTIAGARLIAYQVDGGLAQRVRQWQQCLEAGRWESIREEASQVLRDSEPARLIISGCTIVLIGPPNTGKSTLLNALAGREKALVTDVKGTTRDWVSAEIHIPPLAATVIDTAGLDADLAAADQDGVDRAAQAGSIEIVAQADIVLLVLDAGRPASQLDAGLVERLAGKRIVTVLNKSDLPPHCDAASLPEPLRPAVPISAKQQTGIPNLIQAIHQAFNVTDFDHHTSIAFTLRQLRLLDGLSHSSSKEKAVLLVTELFEGSLSV